MHMPAFAGRWILSTWTSNEIPAISSEGLKTDTSLSRTSLQSLLSIFYITDTKSLIDSRFVRRSQRCLEGPSLKIHPGTEDEEFGYSANLGFPVVKIKWVCPIARSTLVKINNPHGVLRALIAYAALAILIPSKDPSGCLFHISH